MVAGVLAVCRMSRGGGGDVRWADEHERGALPQQLTGDEDRLAQILLNLLTNALKFADGTAVTRLRALLRL